jgi:hypothetical protein
VFRCPSVDREREGTMPAIGYAPTEISDTNYMANGYALGRPSGTIKRSSAIILLHEAAARSNAVFCRPIRYVVGDFYGIYYYYREPPKVLYQQWHKFENGIEEYANAHDFGTSAGGSNLIFLDGHGEYRRYKFLRSGDYGLTPDEPWSKTNSQFPDTGGNSLGAPYKPAW